MNQRHGVTLSIILVAVLLMCSCSGSKEIRKAKEFLDAGMFDQATILLKQEIQTDPKNAEAHMLLGIAYLGQGMNALAEQELNTAIVLDSGLNKEASKRCYEVAKHLVKTNKSKAHAALMKAKEYDPTLEKDEQFIFLAYIHTEENSMARMEGAKKYLTLFPSGANTAQATYELAEGLFSSGDKDQAKVYYNQLVSQFAATEWAKKAGDRLARWIDTKVLSVPAEESSFDTGITLTRGARLTIEASGQWSNNGSDLFSPNGASGPYPGTVIASANIASLIGKIGEEKFVVGERYSGTSPASGQLILMMNDIPGQYTDNSGALSVQVSYSSK
jgi:tetratricopeptide (TPR) repeat protein